VELSVKTNPGKKLAAPASAETQTGISRRELLQICVLGCAGLLGTQGLAGTLVALREPGGPVRRGQVLSEAQMRLLCSLVEVIIPATDTPGAAATDTHGFIDDQLANCRAPDEAAQFIAQLDLLNDQVQKSRGKAFHELSSQEMTEVMTAVTRNEEPFEVLDTAFFYKLKALTVLGYYSSQEGASQELVYLPIPGGYRGDFTLADSGGKAFSPHVF